MGSEPPGQTTAVHCGAPQEPLRTAVRAEMAKSGHTIHPVICRSDATSCRWSWLRVGVTGKRFVKMNYCAGPGDGARWKCNHPGGHARSDCAGEAHRILASVTL